MLLSVSITSRRDKTILYTRVAMSLIIISSLFANNTFYLSVLANGISLYCHFYIIIYGKEMNRTSKC